MLRSPPPSTIRANGPSALRVGLAVGLALALGSFAPAAFGGLDDSGPTTQIALSGPTGQNGWWTGAVTATLSCFPGSAPCTVTEYRLDGGAWVTYTGSFSITSEGTSLLEARSVDTDNQIGPSIERSIRIDTTAPTLGQNVAGSEGLPPWHTSPIAISLTCSDGASGCAAIRYSLNGAPSTTQPNPIAISTDGSHTVRARVEDNAGLRSAVTTSTFHLDQVAPKLRFQTDCDTPGLNNWCRGTLTRGATSSDATSGIASLECTIDLVAAPCTTTALTASTQHTFAATTSDAAGHVSTGNVLVQIDSVAPKTTSSLTGTLAPDGWFLSAVEVQLSCTDDLSGCTNTEYQLDDNDWTPYNGPFTISQAGEHTLTVRSIDVAGNLADATARPVRIDLGPFDLSLGATGTMGNGDWFHSSVDVAVTCEKHGRPCEDVRLSIDSQAPSTYTGPRTVGGEARHTATAESYNPQGELDTRSDLAFGIDMQPPTITIGTSCATAGESNWCRGDITVTPTASDATSGIATHSCALDRATIACSTFVVASDGMHTVSVRASDHAGHETDFSDMLRRDNTAPSLELVAPCWSPGHDNWCKSGVTITPKITDATSGIHSSSCFLNGVAFTCDAHTLDVDGIYSITLHAQDAAGNTATKAFKIKVDQTPPDVTIDARCPTGFRGAWCASPVKLVGAGADRESGLNNLTCTLDGAPTPCAATEVSSPGPHVFTVTGHDKAGHPSVTSRSFSIDTTAPHLERIAPVEGCSYLDDSVLACTELATTSVGTLTISGAASDELSGLQHVDLRIDGILRASFTTASFAWAWDASAEAPGRHAVTLSAFDVAGNRADATLSVTVLA